MSYVLDFKVGHMVWGLQFTQRLKKHQACGGGSYNYDTEANSLKAYRP